jgi:hypothetical protein
MSGSKSVDNGVRIVDVTGDGLPDFLKCNALQKIRQAIAGYINNTHTIVNIISATRTVQSLDKHWLRLATQ